MAVLVRQVW